MSVVTNAEPPGRVTTTLDLCQAAGHSMLTKAVLEMKGRFAGRPVMSSHARRAVGMA